MNRKTQRKTIPAKAKKPCDWRVNKDGAEQVAPQPTPLARPYRLYHLLSDIDQLLDQHNEPWAVMDGLLPLVRRLVSQPDWLDPGYLQPDDPWAVYTLFDAPGYLLTVQTTVWAAGQDFPPHNHGGWGIVAVLAGTEENTFWQRTDTPAQGGPAQLVVQQQLEFYPGDIIAFAPEVIHSIRASALSPTATFNIYGPANYTPRFEYDLDAGMAHAF
ncbi:cysteine dioxygenase family protein [Anthocerotibacter panamensis]|uniref:cysteine dioxygenase family protein n=1 Tax=Anthocerotibacter panamensis TaxID=2857077 RepID=UPI001C408AA7|nr:hypothetical protein [Anthocerotibacter panamensis]